MKTKTIYTCQKCGSQSAKWLGKCPDCNSWNSFVEEQYAPPVNSSKSRQTAYQDRPVLLEDVRVTDAHRFVTGISELDRVLGGGIVVGSVVLIGGDPGIGKSTISLQISSRLTKMSKTVLYVSGEESVSQTKLRAQRLGAAHDSGKLYIVNQTDALLIKEYINELKPDLVIVDSIQVIFNPEFDSSAGSVSQVRECASLLTQIAKSTNTTVFIIGHVTKEGTIAGPRVLEHIVDTVLYFEGERFSTYRILRAVKNRFGSTNEIGVFEMDPAGLREVANPSEIFLAEKPQGVAGSVVTATVEGTRPLLVEVQALVSRAAFGYPARRCQGFDNNRLSLLVAVLEKRLGLALETEDVFVNVVGGIKIEDPAADLCVALAVAGAFLNKKVPASMLVLGELGLTGEIRSISQAAPRITEGAKLGFTHCLVPKNSLKGIPAQVAKSIKITPISNIKEVLDIATGGSQ